MVLWGEARGGKRDPQKGGVLLLVRGCSVGQGCSELQLILKVFPTGGFKEKIRTRFAIKIRILLALCFPISFTWCMGKDK